MQEISSISALVTELGGPSELGGQLGISQEAVSNWVIRNCVPGGWHLQLAAMVHRNGKRVNPSVFNLTEADVDGLFPPPTAKRRQHVAA